MKKLLLVISAVLLSSFSVMGASKVVVRQQGQESRLEVNGKLVARLRTRNGSLSPRQRADLAAKRLRGAISSGATAKDVSVKPVGSKWGVYLKGGLLLVATPSAAKERNETAKKTATRWAGLLKQALRLAPPKPRAPKPTPPPTTPVAVRQQRQEITVPLGEERVITVPLAASAIEVTTDAKAVATGEQVAGKAQIRIRAEGPGKALIHVRQGKKQVWYVVRVMPRAGAIGEEASAAVTGEPATEELVQRAAELGVRDALKTRPGARVELVGQATGLRALQPGESTTVGFPVRIVGKDMIPVEGVVQVAVSNRKLTLAEPIKLYYSNEPENVRQYATLYEGAITDKGSVRLFLHHMNRMGKPFVFQVHLTNPTQKTVEVQVIEGVGGPAKSPVDAGHHAGARFMRRAQRNQGVVVRLEPGASLPIITRDVAPLLTISGIYDLRVLGQGEASFVVQATPQPRPPKVRVVSAATGTSSPHVYPRPVVDVRATHKVRSGKRTYTFVSLGRNDDLKSLSGEGTLQGNYGVLYRIRCEISNPTDEERTVRVVVSPEAGWARGVFYVDGTPIELGNVAPPAEITLMKVRLKPGEKREIEIQSIPVGGSAYPVTVVIRS